ncbi:FCD domain-containing protein [Thauera linaloolentis]|uniref:Transcriptional regulator n=1 Tax=Thauera linaloolentis (strain DSM 12138 / JCM 21573 / CCUG 41526 / CIP 105981 / IAM 15112 / NBRC 102519 / 47Lol) TaxID=1123367 RepID=N6YYH4_THAL4|nr:FCD domain-containing protein [Thauera linaloolentis]ENO84974.1 transcriptional regulator [Thauera linaloolentis 47Lol = DSM 12138]MCM8566967.1 FCD domain-containing protein [Thauera linaloolentis]
MSETALPQATPTQVALTHGADFHEEPKTLVEGAYQRLRRDIIEGVHAPGEKLRVEHLKERYDVGAGTLREALLLLVTDALVVAQGQRGFRVAPISIADFEDITRTRVLLETEALRQSIACGGEDWEAGVVAAFHRLSRAEQRLADHDVGTTQEWEIRNRAFHEALIAASGSRWIRHFQHILYQQSERYRRISLFRQPIARDIHAEHQALFEATMARDATRATSILTEHILRTLDAVKRMPADFFTNRSMR